MKQPLFDPGPKTYGHLLDRFRRQLDLKYRDHTTAQNFTLQPMPPAHPAYEQNPLFEASPVVEPPQKETLFPDLTD